MKFSHLLAAGSAALISYWAVSNRDKITRELKETHQQIQAVKDEYQSIQTHAKTIQENIPVVQQFLSDLGYQYRVYQQEIAGNILEIQQSLQHLENPPQ